jgi:hypothetical protein
MGPERIDAVRRMTNSNTPLAGANSHDSLAAPTRHLGQKELARRWGLSHRTLERWRSQGHGPRFLKLNGRCLYRIEDDLPDSSRVLIFRL